MDGVTLDREDFRQWLAAKEPDELVTGSGVLLTCPAAAWVEDRTNHAAGVYNGAATICTGEVVLTAPWLKAFEDAIDELPGDWDTVTAKQALGVLDALDVA